ncbi:hypothetical protein IL332_14010 [Aeromonas caviae]|nr:hypothetical protein IL332_14010 [Aeromonas caviae]
MDQHDSRAFALFLEVQSWVLLQNDTLSVVGSIAIIFNTLKEKDFIHGGDFFVVFFQKYRPGIGYQCGGSHTWPVIMPYSQGDSCTSVRPLLGLPGLPMYNRRIRISTSPAHPYENHRA